MKAFMDWYAEPNRDHGDWALTQAMMTIARSHATKPDVAGAESEKGRPGGRTGDVASRLEKGREPVVARLACPLEKVPTQLAGKDWTKYEGLLHTDHAVREEFFDGRSEPITSHKPPFMDFTYLYDSTQPDFTEFSAGTNLHRRRGLCRHRKPRTLDTSGGLVPTD